MIGVSEHPDDADLQSQLEHAKVEPKPRFVYQPMTVDGKSYGVIEIPVDRNGPYLPTKDYGGLRAHRIYFRRGTQNAEATNEERKRIYSWFLDQPIGTPKMETDRSSPIVLKWDEFVQASHHFDRNRRYVFVLGPYQQELTEDQWRYFAILPASIILDFDPHTEENGVYSIVTPMLKKYRSVHLWTIGNESTMVPDKACYWFAARGLSGLGASLIDDDWQQWNRKYNRKLRDFLEEFTRSIDGRPVTVICLWYAPNYLDSICTIVDYMLGDAADYVFAVAEGERLSELAEKFKATIVSISLQDMLYGISQDPQFTDDVLPATASIPKADGSFLVLSKEDLNWLSED